MESHWHGAPCCNRCFPSWHMSCDHNNLMESHWHGALLQKVLSILAYELWSQQPNGEPLTWGGPCCNKCFPYWHMSCDHNNLMESHWHGGTLLQQVLFILAYELCCDHNNLMESYWCGPCCQLQQVCFPLCNCCCNGLKIVTKKIMVNSWDILVTFSFLIVTY
jgi:hypothetical protein